MKLPKWVVTDLDETLLHNNRSISQRTLDAIETVRARGCKFAIATTRSKSYAKEFIDILQPDAMVLSGGAIAYRGDAVHYQMPIDRVMLDHLLNEFLQGSPARSWALDTAQGRFSHDNHPALPLPLDVYSMFVWTESNHAVELAEKWKEIATVTALWEPDLYRLSHVHATKLAALKHLLDDVDPKEVVCFGDDLMDVGMLGYFTGIAVKNAKAAAMEAATFITESNEDDGVALWLEANIIH